MHARSPALRLLALLGFLLVTVRLAECGGLTVATYNLQNYTLENRRLEDGGFRPDYPKPEAEKAALRRVIAALDADVIALQEIGGEPFLRELRRDLAADGVNYPYGEAALAADESRGLGVLSRVPLARVTLHRDLIAKRRTRAAVAAVSGVGASAGASAGGDLAGGDAPAEGTGVSTTTAGVATAAGEPVRRGLLEVEIAAAEAGGAPLTLFVVHLKSRLAVDRDDPAAEDQRVGEAQAVRERVLARFPEPARARFVVLGDFNDLPESRALRAVQARGKTEIARWIDAADERGARWTHVYDRLAVYSRFDHALVSPGLLAETADGGGAPPPRASARIVGEPWELVRRASDHRPLVLRLEW